MQTAEELAATIPDLRQSLEREALSFWLDRNGLTIEELRVGGIHAARPKHLVEARRLAAEFLRGRGWSLPMIARELGYAEHTAVLYLLRSRRTVYRDCVTYGPDGRRLTSPLVLP